MDSEGSSFQSGLTPLTFANVPTRTPVKMPAGELIAWTPTRIAGAMASWMMHETQLPAGLPGSALAATQKRRA